jgi:diguanylate cyclase (GGDEF)-like protein
MKILIAEDDPVSSRVLTTTLKKWGHQVVATEDGLQAWKALQEQDAPRLAILDWMMPGMEGPEVCRRVRANIATAPVYMILLTAMGRKEDVVDGLEAGADDYLIKPFDRHELRVRLQAGIRILELQSSLSDRIRELETAIVERNKAEEALRQITLTDDLTGLYNHRGFFTLAAHHAKSARRNNQNSLLIYADMDGLKEINDRFGHAEGSLAIAKTAEILRQTFRDSDIIGRLGGDEFAILAENVTGEELANIEARLQENLRTCNEQSDRAYQLSLSVGGVCISHDSTLSIEQLLAKADEAMYRNKQNKRCQSNRIIQADDKYSQRPYIPRRL